MQLLSQATDGFLIGFVEAILLIICTEAIRHIRRKYSCRKFDFYI